MTDKLQALVASLRDDARTESLFGEDVRQHLSEHAADAILALIAENERLQAAMNPDWDVKSAALESVREHMEIAAGLRAELAMLRIEMGRVYRQQAEDLDAASDAMEFAEKERDQLRARIAELEGQEPVAWKYQEATYPEGDLRGRGWRFHQFSMSKPDRPWMQDDVIPLFFASGAAQKEANRG